MNIPFDRKLIVKLRSGFIQATRTEPAKQISYWDLQTPNGWVACKDIEEARELASKYGCTILL